MNDWIAAPSCMSDKLTDWNLLCAAGGQVLIDGKDVLDAGPAWGIDAFWLSWWARRWVTLDSSPNVLEHLRRHMPKTVEIAWGELTERWPFDAASFDTVLDFSSFDDSVHAGRCYAAAALVLRPGGVLLSTFGNANVIKDSRTYSGKQDPAEVVKTLQGLGFEIKRLLGTDDQARAGIWAVKR